MAQESNKPEADSTTEEPAAGSTSPETPSSSTGSAAPAQTEPPTAGPSATTESEQAGAPRRRGRGPLVWLGFFALAVVPAVVVGIVVYVLASGGGNGSGNAAGIVDGLIRLGPSQGATVNSFEGELPPDFVSEFPVYEGADVVVSVSIATEQGTSYFVVLNTGDPVDEVYRFYSEALDQDPWQVEIGRASEEFTGLRFLRPDNASVTGDITLHQSELDDRTSIYLSYEDVSQAATPGGPSDPFNLGATRALPPGFPDDIPIYSGTADSSVVLDTYFERGQGGQAFIVTFLTPDTQDEVIDFYTQEFEGRGWNVTEPGALNQDFALSIEFDDGNAQNVQGSITADSFDEDPSYTKVDLLVQVSSARRDGN